MKTFVTTLAIVVCVGTFLSFRSVSGNGSGIAMMSSDGSYIPGTVSNEMKYFFNYFIAKPIIFISLA